MQLVLTVILFVSLPLWKSRNDSAGTAVSSDDAAGHTGLSDSSGKESAGQSGPRKKPLSLRQVLSIRGAKEIMIAFFCYSAIEQTAMLWASNYFVMKEGLTAEKAASLAGLFAIGITGGRALSGFMTLLFSDTAMIRIGQGLILGGILVLLLPFGAAGATVGLISIGLGCAPIYPCIIHSTPVHFGEDNSQAVIGVQMAFAYIGTMAMPPLFGVIAQAASVRLLPVYLLVFLAAMTLMHERLVKITP